MFVFQQSRLTERVSNNTQLRMRQFYFSGLLRRIDSHYGSKVTKVSNYSRYFESKIRFCLLFPFSYEQILYEPYLFQDFPYLRDIGSDGKVFCSFCSTTFSITNSDRAQVKSHKTTCRHKSSVSARAGSSSMNTFFKRKEPTNTEYEFAAQEGSFAYHTIHHNHSFRSMDCTGSMICNFYQQKFTCARTKCEAIVKNIFAPWALELVSQDLIKTEATALSIDTSNHGHLKLLPILARFYNNESNEIATKLIDFIDAKGETAEIISSEILKVIDKFGDSDKIVAMSADNTNSNFCGLNRAGRVNVHTKVKTALQREVIGLGCQRTLFTTLVEQLWTLFQLMLSIYCEKCIDTSTFIP